MKASDDGGRLPHFQPYGLNLLSISEAAVIFCHAESDPTPFYCSKRASRLVDLDSAAVLPTLLVL